MESATLAKAAIRHPCFDEEAHDNVGRVHLPVALACNIQCNFCNRKICANLQIQHPGWTAKMMGAKEAAALVSSLVRSGQADFVVGVAGPGEPLANEETFRTLSLVHAEHPWLAKCVSTNGLLLEERLSDLIETGVRAVTVTVNAPDSRVGSDIYLWVRYHGQFYYGQEAAGILLELQLCGIRAALSAGLRLKVNCVLIPGVNSDHVVRLAGLLQGIGVPLMNIMPLIPGGKMKHLRAPTCEELCNARDSCSKFVPQFRRCEQCRADVVRIPHAESVSAHHRHIGANQHL